MAAEAIVLNATDTIEDKDDLVSSNPSGFAVKLYETGSALKSEFITETGGVDYARLVASEAFQQYQKLARQLKYLNLAKLSEAERKAFFLNIYNLLTMHALSAQKTMPGKPLDVKGFYSNYRYAFCDGFELSLDDIEHGLLRCNRPHPSGKVFFPAGERQLPGWATVGDFDCRIHFALNCGAKSCPAVRFFKDADLDRQLQKAAASFCSQEIKCARTDSNKLILKMSKIFMWYGDDFKDEQGNGFRAKLAGFVSDEETKAALADTTVEIIFEDYDWSTNAA